MDARFKILLGQKSSSQLLHYYQVYEVTYKTTRAMKAAQMFYIGSRIGWIVSTIGRSANCQFWRGGNESTIIIFIIFAEVFIGWQMTDGRG